MAKKSQPKPTSDSTPEKKKKEYKLDLFNQTLPALYKCDLDFYANCTEEQRKEITPLILMRWVSLAASHQETAPVFVNTFVNNGFWQLSKHPELQWKQLCVVASEISPRSTPRHTWMMPKKKVSKTPLLDAYFIQMHPFANDAELELLRSKLEDEAAVRDLAEQFGATDGEIKNVVKEYRDNYGKKA